MERTIATCQFAIRNSPSNCNTSTRKTAFLRTDRDVARGLGSLSLSLCGRGRILRDRLVVTERDECFRNGDRRVESLSSTVLTHSSFKILPTRSRSLRDRLRVGRTFREVPSSAIARSDFQRCRSGTRRKSQLGLSQSRPLRRPQLLFPAERSTIDTRRNSFRPSWTCPQLQQTTLVKYIAASVDIRGRLRLSVVSNVCHLFRQPPPQKNDRKRPRPP